jgi:GNAT superfamily N-acetyltransferase
MARTTTRSQFEATNYADVIRPVASPAALRDHIACLAESLRRKNAEALGFLPRRTYYDAIHRDRLVCTLENDEPCGILLWGRRRERVKIHQTVVAPDCRRLLHATHAVEAILEHDDAKTASVLQLRCALDLPAIHFWKAIGMKHIYTTQGKLWPGRQIAVMRMSIANRRLHRRKMIGKLIELAIANPEL